MKKLIKISAFVLSLFIVTAYGSKQSTPEETAEAAVIAVLNVDFDAIIALTDPSIFKELDIDPAAMDPTAKAVYIKKLKFESEDMKSEGITSDMIEISDVEYSDDKNTAHVKVNYTDSDVPSDPMTLKKIDNKWYMGH